jgi:hypothetical protein
VSSDQSVDQACISIMVLDAAAGGTKPHRVPLSRSIVPVSAKPGIESASDNGFGEECLLKWDGVFQKVKTKRADLMIDNILKSIRGFSTQAP